MNRDDENRWFHPVFGFVLLVGIFAGSEAVNGDLELAFAWFATMFWAFMYGVEKHQ